MSLREWVRRKAERSSLTDWIIAFFTAVLFGANVYQFAIIRGQLDAMRKDERPWITPVLKATPQIQGAIVGTFSFVNDGKTPAASVKTKVAIETVKSGERPKFDYPRPYLTSDAGIVYPNVSTPDAPVFRGRYGANGTVVQNPFTEAEIADATQSKTHIVAYGTITYADIFGKNYWTKFCVYLTFGGLPLVSARHEPETSCANYSDIDHQ